MGGVVANQPTLGGYIARRSITLVCSVVCIPSWATVRKSEPDRIPAAKAKAIILWSILTTESVSAVAVVSLPVLQM
jgi:hypothetical protein